MSAQAARETIVPGVGLTSLPQSQNNYLQVQKLVLRKSFSFFYIVDFRGPAGLELPCRLEVALTTCLVDK